MTNRQKQELQRDFFRKAGPNIEVFRRMFDLIPDTKFFIINKLINIIIHHLQEYPLFLSLIINSPSV